MQTGCDQAVCGIIGTTTEARFVVGWGKLETMSTYMREHFETLLAALVVFVFGLAGFAAHAAEGTASKADQQCLVCHSNKGLEKKLPNGETLSLHIDEPAFARSAHNVLGCSVCHGDVTLENHPPLKKQIKSVRDNSLAMAAVCRNCHANVFERYEAGMHAALLRAGNPAAPFCTDCHNPHAAVAKAAFDLASGAPCSNCHSSIFTAYSDSVHGRARGKGRIEAPVCSTCHGAHDVTAASGGDHLKNACFGCHAGALSAHQKWLPNAQRHLDTISCAACHTPGAKRKVDLRLYDTAAQKGLTEKQGVPQFDLKARAVDTEDKGLSSGELQRLLQEFNHGGNDGKTILRGRLEVDGAVEIHQLADKSRAAGQCESCHRAGSAPFQRVTISIADQSGRRIRYDAHQEVLTSAISVDSIRGFYVIGGTRIELLDVLVLLALMAGIGGPIAHLTLSWWFRRNAKRIGGRDDS